MMRIRTLVSACVVLALANSVWSHSLPGQSTEQKLEALSQEVDGLQEKVSAGNRKLENVKDRVTTLEEQVLKDPTCPNGWLRFQSSCYGIGAEAMSWGAAQAACAVYGATLAEVDNAQENVFLKGIARARKYSGMWIGATDTFSEGHWAWSHSGMPLEIGFTDWYNREPSNGGGREDCLNLWHLGDYRWNDYSCDANQQYVCEIRMG